MYITFAFFLLLLKLYYLSYMHYYILFIVYVLLLSNYIEIICYLHHADGEKKRKKKQFV